MMSDPDTADTAEDHVGYESLMIACVTQAIEDYLDGPGEPLAPGLKRHARARASTRRKRYESATRYIFDDTRESRECIFGFAFILMSIGIDPETARQSILRRTRCKDKEKAALSLDPMYAFPENNRHGESA
jgi:hypothetical protein